MADYLPLLSRAIDDLEQNTGENRRALYARARAALIDQLRNADPPLAESEITRERLALEEAIRKVEVQAIKHALLNGGAPPPPLEEVKSSLRERGLQDFREKMADVDVDDADADEDLSLTVAPAYEADKRMAERPLAQPYTRASEAAAKMGEAAAFDAAPALNARLARSGTHEGSEATLRSARLNHRPPPPVWSTDDDEPDLQLPGGRGRVFKIIFALLLLGSVAALGFWQRDTIFTTVANLRGLASDIVQPAKNRKTVNSEQPRAPKGEEKISDRIAPALEDGALRPTTAPAAAAQKVVLYEEDPQNPQGRRYVGSAIWRNEVISPGAGIAPERVVRADIEIPEKHMRMSWLLRRNVDAAASHLIEVMFTLSPNFPEGGIGNIPGTLMKQSEQARGVPLAGLAVKVTNNYFFIGLSAVDADKQRNIQLLKERSWFDIPIVYQSGKRAILALEKGTPGERAFEEAFRAWGE